MSSPRPKTIVVIDDDEAILEAIKLLLTDAGYEVGAWPTYTGRLFGEKAALPDLIVLDMLLSGQDGRDIARILKGDAKTKHIPIIMMSAHPQAEKSILEESNADDFLPKPFDARDFLDRIARQLEKTK
jgi:DNA-binding response OmpR family regulator